MSFSYSSKEHIFKKTLKFVLESPGPSLRLDDLVGQLKMAMMYCSKITAKSAKRKGTGKNP
jgi:hypothetical protein